MVSTASPGSGWARAERVWRAARLFAERAAADGRYRDLGDEPAGGPAGAAADALRKLARDWPALRTGTLTGEQAYAAEAGLWERLMAEPPMGAFARLAATFVNDRAGPGDLVVELGAGVGATSRLLRLPESATFLRTDANPMLVRRRGLPGTPARYDFDEPSPVRDAAIVLAVNSPAPAPGTRSARSGTSARCCAPADAWRCARAPPPPTRPGCRPCWTASSASSTAGGTGAASVPPGTGWPTSPPPASRCPAGRT